ncbi:trypsin-like serine protease [Phenylobacterium sp. SCN 70-31]|uniref:trypsin-like serine protease n=1 Tax=Phenylobacterium sp. SCN 70-31 TaxID=1660129 RepID=UPI000B0DAEAE|nr:trypsin-like serine protease [Phenylobacterium sp. SCN 70-31]
MSMRNRVVAAAAALACVPAVASSALISGEFNGVTWTAANTIVGLGSSATALGGGDPIYGPIRPQHNGVVSIISTYAGVGSFICTGSLLSDRRSVVTAGHCVTDGDDLRRPDQTTVFFYGGDNPDAVLHANADATAVAVTDYFVNPDYTGEVIDQNDVAVLRLAEFAPGYATAYDIYDGGDLTGQGFNVAGVGRRSDTGGEVGHNLGSGILRQGDNAYAFRLGDDDFGGFWDGFFGTADVTFSYLSDFDSGLALNDTSCRVAAAFGLGGAKYCGLGVGGLEVGTAPGDSGGPQFIDGRIASISSYGLSFGSAFGDVDDVLNSTFGEFNGLVPLFLHADFIRSAMVPEPSAWALMIGGFGLAGAGLRRRRGRAGAIP